MARQPDKPPAAPQRAPRRLDSTVLFKGARRLIIEHGGDAYLLRITQRES